MHAARETRMSDSASSLPAAIAAHRFGPGEASLDVVGSQPALWLAAKIGPADARPASDDDCAFRDIAAGSSSAHRNGWSEVLFFANEV